MLEDKPSDHYSRWSSENNFPEQFLQLQLDRPAILQKIVFGKFEKMHVCNMKKFKVFGGLEPTQVKTELLDSGLRNDSVPETLSLRHEVQGRAFACRYVRIVPTQSWGPSFNYSIWYVELHGREEEQLVRPALSWLTEFREREAIRLCLKHLRQHKYTDAFESLEKRTKVQLEHQTLSKLHDMLVVQGDFRAVEQLLQTAAEEGMFNDYVRRLDYKTAWTPIHARSQKPGMRGGHQMVIDPTEDRIYLFGGWNGQKDMSDFWSYSIRSNTWTCLDTDTSASGGPTPRSCHKMAIDTQRKKIFILGRYVDFSVRTRDNVRSDFFVYDIESNSWQMITDDTFEMGGPRLLFEHQVAIDMRENTLYVFGGRQFVPTGADYLPLIGPTDQIMLSGLYAFHVPTSTWKCLRPDCIGNSVEPQDMRLRTGHSVLFHEKSRLLYVFAGQRQKEHLRDFLSYDVDTDQVRVIFDGNENLVPEGVGGCTQRATIDPDLDEVHVFSGSNKEKRESLHNSFWVYDMLHKRWSCIHRISNVATAAATDSPSSLTDLPSDGRKDGPTPRYAHQLVYDHLKKVHYLFGGNPGYHQTGINARKDEKYAGTPLRLDDFWCLQLKRPAVTHLVRKCRQMVRELEFRELVSRDQISGIAFLRTQLSETFDHADDGERRKFQSLASLIFASAGDDRSKRGNGSQGQSDHEDGVFRSRSQVYDRLVHFFPPDMTQPTGNLMDLIQV